MRRSPPECFPGAAPSFGVLAPLSDALGRRNHYSTDGEARLVILIDYLVPVRPKADFRNIAAAGRLLVFRSQVVAANHAAAATTIFQRIGVPRRAVTILEGESLLNDATALVAYRLQPAIRDYLIAGHQSAEPAHQHVLTELGLEPLGPALRVCLRRHLPQRHGHEGPVAGHRLVFDHR